MTLNNNGGTASTVTAARASQNTRDDYTDAASKIATLEERLETTSKAYEQVLWLYAEGVCRCTPDRLEYLMSVELPFNLRPYVLVDLELLVKHILESNDSAVRL